MTTDREQLRTELIDTLIAAPSYYSRREAVEIVDALLPMFCTCGGTEDGRGF